MFLPFRHRVHIESVLNSLMASDVGPDPSYTIPYGPLTTLWTPHSSCLFTITSYSGSYYQGYIPSLGVDPACYPPSNAAATTSVIVTSTPQSEPSLSTSRPIPDTTTGVVPRDLVNAVNLYSPGICPSGWTYALSCERPSYNKSCRI